MDLDPRSSRSLVTTAVVAVVLVVSAVGLGLQIAMISRAARELSPAARDHLGRIAWIALILLTLDLLAMFWLGIRVLAGRFGSSLPRRKQLPYVDAWSVAGKRFRLDEEEEGGESSSETKDPPN